MMLQITYLLIIIVKVSLTMHIAIIQQVRIMVFLST